MKGNNTQLIILHMSLKKGETADKKCFKVRMKVCTFIHSYIHAQMHSLQVVFVFLFQFQYTVIDMTAKITITLSLLYR